VGRVGGSKVDIESNLTVLEVESYHPPFSEEVGGFSHCENRLAAQALKDCGLAPGFVTAEEEEVTVLDFLRLTNQADMEYTGSDGLALDGAFQFLAAWLVIEDAEAERSVSRIHGAGRPV
jgi:hypothetical protein